MKKILSSLLFFLIATFSYSEINIGVALEPCFQAFWGYSENVSLELDINANALFMPSLNSGIKIGGALSAGYSFGFTSWEEKNSERHFISGNTKSASLNNFYIRPGLAFRLGNIEIGQPEIGYTYFVLYPVIGKTFSENERFDEKWFYGGGIEFINPSNNSDKYCFKSIYSFGGGMNLLYSETNDNESFFRLNLYAKFKWGKTFAPELKKKIKQYEEEQISIAEKKRQKEAELAAERLAEEKRREEEIKQRELEVQERIKQENERILEMARKFGANQSILDDENQFLNLMETRNPFAFDKNKVYYCNSGISAFQYIDELSFLAEVGYNDKLFITTKQIKSVHYNLKNCFLKYIGTYSYQSAGNALIVVPKFELLYFE